MRGWFVSLFSLLALAGTARSRKHHLVVSGDSRPWFLISKFGFLRGGHLSVNLSEFRLQDWSLSDAVGFTLERTASGAALRANTGEGENGVCPLKAPTTEGILQLIIDSKKNSVVTRVPPDLKDLFPSAFVLKEEEKRYYSLEFSMRIEKEEDEGLFALYFHNCPLSESSKIPGASFNLKVEERNNENYLSAGEIPLPALYITASSLFFLSGIFWVVFLKKNGSERVFRIHWIMAALVFLKSLSLFFHGINYHKIETNGIHIESWAVLYYITHLLKGGLLFFTIVLIGSGWAFIKHVLSDKEKRIFMIVLPMQILANVAYIIVEESEEGEVIHNYWKDVFILVDLLCCGAIFLPVVWSIRHLQESSGTDGKATISLEKLKLFKHFYIMVVCYIYFTRIIIYLLKITVPFKYEWLDETFLEAATFLFFVMTGYKFRPASNNPYFSVPTDDYEIEEVIVGKTAINERVINRSKQKMPLLEDDESDDDEGLIYLPDSKKGVNDYSQN